MGTPVKRWRTMPMRCGGSYRPTGAGWCHVVRKFVVWRPCPSGRLPRTIVHTVLPRFVSCVRHNNVIHQGRLLKMSEVRDTLPWSTEDVSVADHGTLALLVQRLPGWDARWRTSTQQQTKTGTGGGCYQYHVDALPWFARAAEILAMVRHATSTTLGEARDRLGALSEGLRTDAPHCCCAPANVELLDHHHHHHHHHHHLRSSRSLFFSVVIMPSSSPIHSSWWRDINPPPK